MIDVEQDLGPEELWRLPRVIAAVGESKTTIYRKIKDGEFPAPARRGHRMTQWNSQDVQRYIRKVISANESQQRQAA